jgi:rare lipoprotein A (peptidoglycan hydrolase)
MKILYEGSLSNSTIETMKSKHGMEFVGVEDHKREIAKKSDIKFKKNKDGSVDMTISGKKAKELKTPAPKQGMVPAGGFTRNNLMLQAKEKGIRNFRVLNKEELSEVLAAAPERRTEIIDKAVKRWKAGWGSKVAAVVAMVLLVCNMAFADTASWYSVESCRKEGTSGIMANGRKLNDEKFTVASWDYKFGTKLKITNTKNGRSVVCEVTDRGPAKKLYRQGRIVDLSKAAFMEIASLKSGIVPVNVKVIR